MLMLRKCIQVLAVIDGISVVVVGKSKNAMFAQRFQRAQDF